MRPLAILVLVGTMFSATAPLSAAQPADQQEPGVLTLQQALQHALTNNPSALRSRSEIDAAESRVRQIRSSVLPQITADGRYTRNDREVAFDLGGENANFAALEVVELPNRLSRRVVGSAGIPNGYSLNAF